MKIIRVSIFVSLFLIGCEVKSTNLTELQEKADILFSNLASGNAETEFPIKYFPSEVTKKFTTDLKDNCDLANRKGNYINEYYSADKSKVSLIYEFYLKCDSIRFILTYNLNDNAELYEFKLEGIEQDNPNITNVSKRLKF